MGSFLSFAGVQDTMVGGDVSSQVGETAADGHVEELTSDTPAAGYAIRGGVGWGDSEPSHLSSVPVFEDKYVNQISHHKPHYKPCLSHGTVCS